MDEDVLLDHKDPGVLLISGLVNGITSLPLFLSLLIVKLKTRPACPEGGLAQKRASGAPVGFSLSDSRGST